MEIILEVVKTYVGVPLEENGFDLELLSLINANFSNLVQIGLEFGSIVNGLTVFPDFQSPELQALVENYICMSTKSVFDPTASATIKSAYDNQIKQLEFRIQMKCSIDEEVTV